MWILQETIVGFFGESCIFIRRSDEQSWYPRQCECCAQEGFDKKSTQVGLNLGAGVKLIKHLQIGVNYQIPLGDSFDLKELKDAGVKNKTWQISAAYIF